MVVFRRDAKYDALAPRYPTLWFSEITLKADTGPLLVPTRLVTYPEVIYIQLPDGILPYDPLYSPTVYRHL